MFNSSFTTVSISVILFEMVNILVSSLNLLKDSLFEEVVILFINLAYKTLRKCVQLKYKIPSSQTQKHEAGKAK